MSFREPSERSLFRLQHRNLLGTIINLGLLIANSEYICIGSIALVDTMRQLNPFGHPETAGRSRSGILMFDVAIMGRLCVRICLRRIECSLR